MDVNGRFQLSVESRGEQVRTEEQTPFKRGRRRSVGVTGRTSCVIEGPRATCK